MGRTFNTIENYPVGTIYDTRFPVASLIGFLPENKWELAIVDSGPS